MSIEPLRDLIAQLSSSATALAVLAAELERRASARASHPSLAPHVDRLLEQIGARDLVDAASPGDVAPLLAELRHFWLLDGDLVASPDRAPGWTYTDAAVLEAGGVATEGFAHALARVAPQLAGLAARLEGPGGAFLDIGTGVGRLAIAVARRWPSLRVVGIDAWAPSLAIARSHVAAAALDGRIELRQQSAETLTDEEQFDLVWLPAAFVAPALIPAIVERARRALRPGGWLLYATARPGDDLRGAAMAFRVALFGGHPASEAEVHQLLDGSGFVEATTLPSPPRDFKLVVAARRPTTG